MTAVRLGAFSIGDGEPLAFIVDHVVHPDVVLRDVAVGVRGGSSDCKIHLRGNTLGELLSQTRFGQHNYAIGANAQAARRAGIDIKSHLLRLYVLSAACAGLGGALYAARFTAGAAQAGEPLLLDSVAAVVIGGASLFGGSGTIIGTVAGALVIAVIQYGLVFMNVEPFWQFIAVGVVIIISVLIDQAQRRFSGAKQDE